MFEVDLKDLYATTNRIGFSSGVFVDTRMRAAPEEPADLARREMAQAVSWATAPKPTDKEGEEMEIEQWLTSSDPADVEARILAAIYIGETGQRDVWPVIAACQFNKFGLADIRSEPIRAEDGLLYPAQGFGTKYRHGRAQGVQKQPWACASITRLRHYKGVHEIFSIAAGHLAYMRTHGTRGTFMAGVRTGFEPILQDKLKVRDAKVLDAAGRLRMSFGDYTERYEGRRRAPVIQSSDEIHKSWSKDHQYLGFIGTWAFYGHVNKEK